MFLRVTILSIAAMAIAAGWYQMFRFSSTPGEQGAAPLRWPEAAPAMQRFALGAGGPAAPLLLVFVHPQCSCTRATMEELDRILDASHAQVRVAIVVYRSEATERAETERAATGGSAQSAADGGGLTKTRNPAIAISGLAQGGWPRRAVGLVPDKGGALARRFGAATSGEAVLYSADGRLLFQGGITAERSHLGDSKGGDALQAALRTGAAQQARFSVFGCPIYLLGHAG